ncbi:MAG: hypothetical protein JNK12_17665 [Acidimicrobiales bacterium]|nr:hypothetical protein [Acidimicrobiales bacterium]
MSKVLVAGVALVALLGLVGCSSGADESTDATDAADATDSTDEAVGDAAAAPECGAAIEPPTLGEDLEAVAEQVAAEAGLADGPGHDDYDDYEVRCDNVGAVTAGVPTAWDQQSPAADGVPQAGFTAGPDLEGRVEASPVVGIGALRFVGDPPTAEFVNTNNAEGSLENGARTLPRRGDSVADGCTPLDALPFTVPRAAAGGPLRGEVQPYVDCDGDARVWLLAAGFPEDGSQYQVQLIGQALDRADLDALLRVLVSSTTRADHVPPQELPPLPAVAVS